MDAGRAMGWAVPPSLQESFPWLLLPMLSFSLLGSPVSYFFFIAALFWCCDVRLGLHAALLLGLSAGANDTLKMAFHTPRPYWIDPAVTAYAAESSFALPSAHAQLAAGFWGFIAVSLRRRWAQVACVLLVLLIGISRVYLGVHSPLDVVAGWLAGLAVLVAFLLAKARLGARIRTWPASTKVVAAFCLSALFPAATLLTLALQGDWQVPLSWVVRAFAQTGVLIDPQDPSRSFLSGGLILGVAAGMAWLEARDRTLGRVCRSLLAARYLTGVAGVLAIWYGTAVLIAVAADGACLLWYMQGALLGLWIAGGAPALFSRLGLAGEK
ncbi:MAG: phosphatase PAP2 family protein [Methanomicrobiaceae archaeon]|nr:phosphatase PAP2 family protein [Methanomicrobiaceae archaeon]